MSLLQTIKPTQKIYAIDWSELFNPSEPRYEPVEVTTIWEVIGEKIGDFILGGLETFVLNMISAMPILIGVSIGVYALISMISKSLARMGVIGVFIYGSLVSVF